ncbi:MAG: hypothetical protein HQK50_04740 [Oligoflexia bacterium]|nr:hypothetical protein [Oligoflexia bacterium]
MSFTRKLFPFFYLFFCILIAMQSPFSYGVTIDKPTPQDILNAQLNCDSTVFKKYPWIPSSGVNQMAKNRLIIVSNIILKDLPFMPEGTKYEDGSAWGQKHSDYDMYYKIRYRLFDHGVDYVDCVSTDTLIKKIYSSDNMKKKLVSDTFEDDRYFIRYKNSKFTMERDGDEVAYSQYPNFIQGTKNDQNNSGLVCMIHVEDFIKDKNAINVDKLCEGQPQSKKELMRWALDNLHEFYKTKYPGWKKTAKPDRK